MTSYCCLHLQCLFDRWHTMSDYLLWWILWHKQISLGSMWHLPGLSPSGENVKSLFFKKIWSKSRVRLIHECSLYTNVAYRRVNSVDLSYITHFVRSKHLIIQKVFVQEKVLAFWDQIICGHGKKSAVLWTIVLQTDISYTICVPIFPSRWTSYSPIMLRLSQNWSFEIRGTAYWTNNESKNNQIQYL